VLPATVACLDAISRSMAELEHLHPQGVLSARALLDAVALIDQQLISGSLDMEQAIAKKSTSGPIATSAAATGDAPLQKADVIAYDTSLLREEIETTYANPTTISSNLITQRYLSAKLSACDAVRGNISNINCFPLMAQQQAHE
jgi:hypothetical protein